ncbi:MAG: BTAD domain-containing putative transcriptional regulator [Kineosporiaceae bacterium]
MHVVVLGSVQLLDAQHRDVLAGAGPRQRALLAALALARHHTLETDLLVDWMWAEHELPASPRNALSLHASRLRAALRRWSAAATLRHEGGRYRLVLPSVAVDVAAFRAAWDDARERHAAAGPAGALSTADRALRGWGGRPLAGLPDTPSVRAHAVALEEEYLAARCTHVEWAIAAGEAAGVLPDLARAVEDHPLDERLRALQVRALDAAGRCGDALAAFAAARRHLVDELGLEPGPALLRAHRDVLAGAPSPEPPRPPAPARLPVPPRPPAVRQAPEPEAPPLHLETRLLHLLATRAEPSGVDDLAHDAGHPADAVAPLVERLVERGWVLIDGAGGVRLHPALVRLAAGGDRDRRRRTVEQPVRGPWTTVRVAPVTHTASWTVVTRTGWGDDARGVA